MLIVGEAGTGKRTLARLVHRRGDRASRRCELVPCAELSEELLARVLFDDGGAFARSAGGVVILDGIHALAPRLCAMLASILAEPPRMFGARVVATALPELREQRAHGRSHEELFYRLATTLLDVPPLRSRADDVPVLVHERLFAHARRNATSPPRVALEAMRRLRRERWPGNVPELHAVVDRAFFAARGGLIVEGDLGLDVEDDVESDGEPPSAGASSDAESAEGRARSAGSRERRGDDVSRAAPRPDRTYVEARAEVLAEFERAYVEQALRAASGNVAQAARIAGMDRANFRRIVRRLDEAGPSGDDE
jgi:anaerobic nitric oxide reductase transcription regulator